MIELDLAEIIVIVLSLLTSGAVAFATWLAKGHLVKIEKSLDTIAEHATKLAVIETKLAGLDSRLAQTETDVREVKAGVCRLLRIASATAAGSGAALPRS